MNSAPRDVNIAAEDFPALRNFLRAYFHQDMKDEYGSPQRAAEQFCRDASPAERAALSQEWLEFLQKMNGRPLAEMNHALNGTLGSSYSISAEDRDKITATLKKS